MPNFEFHYRFGKRVGLLIGLFAGIFSLILTFDPVWAIFGALVGYYSTVVGSVAPDIDLSRPKDSLKSASIPYRKLISIINFIIILVLVLGLARFNQNGIEILNALISAFAVVITIVAIRLVPDVLHRVMPVHRTKIHQISFWFVMSTISAIIVYYLLKSRSYPSTAIFLIPGIIWFSIPAGAFTHISSDIFSTLTKYDNIESVPQAPDWVPYRLPIVLDLIPMSKIVIDKQAPLSVRFLVVFTFGYILFPSDIIPDLFLFLGWIDDFLIYSYLRQTVYNSYQENNGIALNIKQNLLDIRRGFFLAIEIYLIVIILAIVFMLSLAYLALST